MEKPENLIPKEKMVEIIRDLSLLNAAKSTSITVLRRNNIEPMPYLYTKYDIDSTQFSDSDLYYASLPEEYEDIYAKVEARLEIEKEATVEAKKIKDSLQAEERELKKEKKASTDSLP